MFHLSYILTDSTGSFVPQAPHTARLKGETDQEVIEREIKQKAEYLRSYYSPPMGFAHLLLLT